jgi:D-galacturonate reductase
MPFESGKVQREEVFVTTKLWCTYQTQVEENLELSLKNLGLDYVDLYLMHWPLAMNPNGMALALGLSVDTSTTQNRSSG